jgi:hypothetical protein
MADKSICGGCAEPKVDYVPNKKMKNTRANSSDSANDEG